MAVELWSRYPLEIQADLSRFHQRHIREWHQGQMSSFEFLTLVLYGLPDDSEYQKARRNGDWTDMEYIVATIANRLAAQSGQEYEPFLSPAQRAEEVIDDDDDLDDQRGSVLSQMQRW